MNKKLILSALLTLVTLTASAVDKAARLKEIRQAYAEAKKDIAENDKKGAQRMDVTINVNDGSEVSEDFVINDEHSVKYYFRRIHQNGETDLFEPCCYFLVEQWSSNGHTSYREMLFDPFTGHLMFSFMKAETHAGFKIESRYYYDDQGNIVDEKHKVGEGETTDKANHNWSSGGGDQTMAMAFSQIFNDLMKQKGAEAESFTTQQSADKAGLLKVIRAQYTEAKQKIVKDAKSETPMNVKIEIHDQEDPEMPAQKDVLQFWFQHGDEGEGKPYFMSTICQLGDHSVYSEYLFDVKTSALLFCFSQQQQNDGPALEWRYYFDRAGRCIEVKGNHPKNGPGFADRKAAKFYLELFKALVNPSN